MRKKVEEQIQLLNNKVEFENHVKFEQERVKWLGEFSDKLDKILEIQGE